jgi:hypothetical protein
VAARYAISGASSACTCVSRAVALAVSRLMTGGAGWKMAPRHLDIRFR